MLLDAEKSGTGPRRLTRAVAFLEAAGRLDQFVNMTRTKSAKTALAAAADKLRDMAVAERDFHDGERKIAAQ